MTGINNLLDLRAKFVDILDIDKGDGACALSLLDEVINAEQQTKPSSVSSDVQTVFSIAEAIELVAQEFYSEMSFDEIHDMAIGLLEQRIQQLTDQLNEANKRDN